MAETTAARNRPTQAVAAEQALAIAQEDAVKAYRDLSSFRIRLALEADGWHVDYELKDVKLKGGGPHYVIDATAGTKANPTASRPVASRERKRPEAIGESEARAKDE